MKLKKPDRELVLWLLGFLICAIFQFWRHSPMDGFIFLLFSFLLVVVDVREKEPASRVKLLRGSGLYRARLIWVVLFVVGCVWELGSYIFSSWNGDDSFPTISVLVDPFIAHFWGLVVFVLIYAGVAWKLIWLHKDRD